MSNKIISMNSTRTGSALDEFLPERVFAPDPQRAAAHLDSTEVQLEPLEPRRAAAESPALPPLMPPSSQVQLWPMIAAAMVAIGVSLLAFGVFAKFGQP